MLFRSSLSEDGNYKLPLSDIQDNGSYPVSVTAVDQVGNQSVKSFTVQKDDAVPELTLTQVTRKAGSTSWEDEGWTLSKLLGIAIPNQTAITSGIKSVTITGNGTTVDITDHWKENYEFLANGVYTVAVTTNSTKGGSPIVTTQGITVVKVDREIPRLSVAGKYENSATAYASGTWSSQNIGLTFTNQADTKGNTRLYGYIKGQENNPIFYNPNSSAAQNASWILTSTKKSTDNKYQVSDGNALNHTDRKSVV